MRAWTFLVLAALTAACEAGMPVGPGRDAGTDRAAPPGGDGAADSGSTEGGPARDGGATDAGPGADVVGSGGGDAAVLGTGMARGEICGNGFDDDGNGLVVDGCDCAVGTTRACWLGPPAARNVGACHDGVQSCQSDGTHATWAFCMDEVLPTREVLANGRDDDCDGVTDEPDGICVPSANAETGADCTNGRDDDCDTLTDCADPSCAGSGRCPPACASRETVCWGGADEDCDGRVDCADSDCAADPSCQSGPCPAGQTPTYRQRNLGVAWGASSIAAGDGQAVMPVTCEPGACGRGQVAVVLVGQSAVCVPPPGACPAGQSPTYVASGTWRCDPPCELVIHYGSLFGGRSVCAGRPMITCPAGQSPTFVESTEQWACQPTCNNSTYDQIALGGMVVCVPC
jgi:hypothetical protein